MELSLVLKNSLIEIIANSFNSKEINEIGKMLFKEYDNHALCGTEKNTTLSSRKCANILVDHSLEKNKIKDVIEFLIKINGENFLGKHRNFENIEIFLSELVEMGVFYDSRKGRLVGLKKEPSTLANWGSLKDGKFYDITVMSLDIVNNSIMVKEYGNRKMEKVYYQFRKFINEKIAFYNGRIWNFAGDGGLVAFTFKNHIERGVMCALDIQMSLPLILLDQDYKLNQGLELRIALDTGSMKFSSNTGNIISDTINYAAHLEKKGTQPGFISVSDTVMEKLPPRLACLFKNCEEFEERDAYTAVNRLDQNELMSVAIP